MQIVNIKNQPSTEKQDLKQYTLPQMRELVSQFGLREFHALQLFRWIYRQLESDFDNMTNLSKDFRQSLQEKYHVNPLPIETEQQSTDGTRKFLFKLNDQESIEAVLIPEEDRVTLCISCQVGCKMKCDFCATGTMGFTRNLTTAEIVSQVWTLHKLATAAGQSKISNIVFMGMGEPLDNFESVINAAEILMDDQGLGLSQRKVCISTCGIVPKIEELAERSKARLAVSLHSPVDEIRSQLMPINRKYNIEKLFKACRYYYKTTKKRVTFEYTLIKGMNDSLQDAKKLVKLLNPLGCKVNVIPLNPHKGSKYQAPDMQQVKKFQKYLIDHGVRALLRITRGDDINAACGQLKIEQ